MEENLAKTSPRDANLPEQVRKAYEVAKQNCELIFDSTFESGNLDVAIKV